MIAEPNFIASVDDLCGFILVVGDGEVDAFTPSGEWLGVYHDRVEAAGAVIEYGNAELEPTRAHYLSDLQSM